MSKLTNHHIEAMIENLEATLRRDQTLRAQVSFYQKLVAYRKELAARLAAEHNAKAESPSAMETNPAAEGHNRPKPKSEGASS